MEFPLLGFPNLPAEKIEEICLKLDNRSLSKFMQTSKRIHNICYDMYLKRREKYEEIEQVKQLVRKNYETILIKNFEAYSTTIILQNNAEKYREYYRIIQQPSGEKISNLPWINPNIDYTQNDNANIRISTKLSWQTMEKLISQLIKEGYGLKV